ncbi:hypothetical protein VPHK250G1_0083 [Vibrio phage K250 g1]
MTQKDNKTNRRKPEEWIQLAREFLLLKEQREGLTIKQFCSIRSDVAYNSARVKLKNALDRIEAGNDDSVSLETINALDEAQNPVKSGGGENRIKSGDYKSTDKKQEREAARRQKKYEEACKKKSKHQMGNLSAKTHGMYTKYLDPDLVAQAVDGSLQDDVTLYRTKTLMALEFMEEIHEKLADAEHKIAKSKDKDERELAMAELERWEKKAISTDKALNYYLVRLESLAKTLKGIELTSVLIIKERENVIKTKAQTKTLIQQSRKFRAEQQKLKAEEQALKNASDGSGIDKIVRELQEKRDGLPSLLIKKGN